MWILGNRPLALTVTAVVSAAWWATSAWASPIFNETFSYSDGELVAVSGGNWASTGTTDSNFVQSRKLFIDDVSNGKDYTRSIGGPLTTGIVYGGFTLNVSNTDGPSSSTADP